MKKILQLSLNATLVLILISLIALPTGFMGIANYEEAPVVLSAKDERLQDSQGDSFIRSMNDPEANVPEDIREVITRMEEEYYQNNEKGFTQDIERAEELEELGSTTELNLEEAEEDYTQKE